MGCNERTFPGLAGMGDLIVTATSQHSRNNRCGQLIGEGVPTKAAIAQIGMVVEGINALDATMQLASRYGVEMPITEAVDQIVNQGRNPRDVVYALMTREKASEGFANAILASLAFLELDHAVFTVELGAAPEGPTGRDAVRFLFSSTGKAPQDLSKVASGGELSRIMLSLKAMMARYTAMPTLIFDEIDAGVSGSAADRMGQMICRMGEDMQVFAITHLPQVAAKGNAHYLVTKENDVTAIRPLSREERVQEIARLLSGSVITDAAVANARALLAF